MSVKYLALMLLLPLALVGGRAVAAAADHHVSTFHGTVTKTAPDHHWLQVRTRANKVIRFQTPRATSWQGCARDEAHHGHAVTISAYKKAGAWVATTVRASTPPATTTSTKTSTQTTTSITTSTTSASRHP